MMPVTDQPLRVAVVGLLPGQEEKVRRSIRRGIDVRFLPARRRPCFPRSCTRVVLMTRFIGHAWATAAFARFRRQDVSLCPGGTSQLLRLLRWLGGS
jgi:hypothetical protein